MAAVAAAAAGAGAATLALGPCRIAITALAPELVPALTEGSEAEIKGRIVEVFRQRVIVDSGGHALVETGRRGERVLLVSKGEAVTVQGRFGRGLLRTAIITAPTAARTRSIRLRTSVRGMARRRSPTGLSVPPCRGRRPAARSAHDRGADRVTPARRPRTLPRRSRRGGVRVVVDPGNHDALGGASPCGSPANVRIAAPALPRDASAGFPRTRRRRHPMTRRRLVSRSGAWRMVHFPA